jgi:hypothetical protein
LSGPATRSLLQRAYEKFGGQEYVRLSKISVGHLYNLRNSVRYRRQAAVFAAVQDRIAASPAAPLKPEGRGNADEDCGFYSNTQTQERKSAAARPPHPQSFHTHLALESKSRFHAHPWIGKCSEGELYERGLHCSQGQILRKKS